ncbi:hypothetical protein L3Y34_010430 [Caenorhabditis briggsae]|uniref:Uncharacterized protein n=1 Tax=Caenorhabditis briggsae TaxID=6238 RepID=A0AAE8ZMJ8_CAEBR|nr:hypothetical protein L3Y34_010430 [Caenorhabditis briggsae]
MYLCGQKLIRKPKTPQPLPIESQTTYEHLFYRRSLTPAFARPGWIPSPNRVEAFIKETPVDPPALDSSFEDSSDSSCDDSFIDETDTVKMDGIEEYTDDDSFDCDIPMAADSSDDDSSDDDFSDGDIPMENSSSNSESSDDDSSDDDFPRKVDSSNSESSDDDSSDDDFPRKLFQVETLNKLKRLISSSHHLQRLPSPVYLVHRRSFHITSQFTLLFQF